MDGLSSINFNRLKSAEEITCELKNRSKEIDLFQFNITQHRQKTDKLKRYRID